MLNYSSLLQPFQFLCFFIQELHDVVFFYVINTDRQIYVPVYVKFMKTETLLHIKLQPKLKKEKTE